MDLNKLSYEEAMEELETILDKLENTDLSLEDSVKFFRKGIELHKYCSGILTKTEGEIKILLKDEESQDKEGFFEEVD